MGVQGATIFKELQSLLWFLQYPTTPWFPSRDIAMWMEKNIAPKETLVSDDSPVKYQQTVWSQPWFQSGTVRGDFATTPQMPSGHGKKGILSWFVDFKGEPFPQKSWIKEATHWLQLGPTVGISEKNAVLVLQDLRAGDAAQAMLRL